MPCYCLLLWNQCPAALPKYVDIGKAMNVYKDGMSREEAAKAAVGCSQDSVCQGGIPQHLSELGIKEEDLPVWLLLPLQMFVLRAIRVRWRKK